MMMMSVCVANCNGVWRVCKMPHRHTHTQWGRMWGIESHKTAQTQTQHSNKDGTAAHSPSHRRLDTLPSAVAALPALAGFGVGGTDETRVAITWWECVCMCVCVMMMMMMSVWIFF